MSKMMRSDLKPPLARSPIRLRPRRALHSSANTLQSLPGSLTKTQLPKRKRALDIEEVELRHEYETINCELSVLAKMVQDEFGNSDLGNFGVAGTFNANRSPVFERGRFYDEYSAKRNERLKRKKSETGIEKKPAYDLCVRVESAKGKVSKKSESMRKTICSTPTTERRETQGIC
ncbi:unnamed protein product [Ilex paraguariensis]|uniref:Uncharacterized protein n=1 Tax=Ilex paraguariensis TaxID=185542 RepID=A0ABC8U988_9AQUA